MAKISFGKFKDFWEFYQGLPHQQCAIEELYNNMPEELLDSDHDWIYVFRDEALEDSNAQDTVLGKSIDNSWGGIYAAARLAGAKYPEVVAAQWALESGWGKHLSGQNNFFGIKGKPGTACHTWEVYNGKRVEIVDYFRDFDTVQDCIDHLVTQWYKDYKGFKGVNRATSALECCDLLKKEGYATDPAYPAKLKGIIAQQGL